ncbi:BNR repeat, putative [Roseovarius sp. TM1035]|nr:BNR repeat, putative [Roseovarius sp. TM1035]
MTDRAAPVGIGAREPSLATLPDGRIILSWTEEKGAEAKVRMAILDGSEWSDARTIHKSSKIYINWADFPSVMALSNGTLAVQWLELNGTSDYQYDVNIAFSLDEGKSWSVPLIPHDDRSQRQHGFVSLVPHQFGGLTALWLDGRKYESQTEGDSFENAMQLRSRQINSDGTMKPESLLDARACTCCQTSAARTGSGDMVAVYRHRTADEIRDISIVRSTGGVA